MIVPAEYDLKLVTIDNVATLPSIATEILEIMRSRTASMREVARVIEKDPSVITKILKVANSPMWGVSGRVESIQRALVLLGLKQVSNIVIAISLYSTFARLKPNPHFDREGFWKHSIATAFIARRLSRAIGVNFQGEEFTGGLIHDLGKIILDQFWPDAFVAILQEAHQTGQPVVDLERQYLECTHAELGARLLEHWSFPASLVQVLAYHHRPQECESFPVLAAVVNLADHLCQQWQIGMDEDVQIDEGNEAAGWSILEGCCSEISQLDFEQFRSDLQPELEFASNFSRLMKN